MSRNKKVPALLLCLLLLFLCACSQAPDESTAQAKILQNANAPTGGVQYNTAKAQRQTYTQTHSCGVNPAPQTTDVLLKADNVRFVEFYTSTGKWVQKGDPIALFSKESDNIRLEEIHLEIRRLEQSLEDSLPSFGEAIDELKEALEELPFYEREEIEKLEKRIRLQELKRDELMLTTQYQIAGLQKEYRTLKEAENALEVCAPISGYVASTSYIKKGALCFRDQPLFTIYRPEDLLFSANNSTGKLRVGMEVQIEFGPKNNRMVLPGRVVSAANCLPSSLAAESAYILPLDLPKIDHTSFDPSTLLSASVTAESLRLENALLLPRSALLAADGKYLVSILEGESIHKRYVDPVLTSSDMVWIEDGISAGQTIILQ